MFKDISSNDEAKIFLKNELKNKKKKWNIYTLWRR